MDRHLRLTPVVFVCILSSLAPTAPAHARNDWPQVRGPARDGVAPATGLAKDWGAEGPSEIWRQPIGAGFAAPAVVGDRLSTLAAEDDAEVALCLDAGTGDTLEIWRTPRMRNHFNNAVIVEGHLYGFDNATFRRLNLADGSERWSRRGFGKGSLVAPAIGCTCSATMEPWHWSRRLRNDSRSSAAFRR